jgi:DNA-directed RNA polymerase subunit N (RpoN/RPB10)
MAEKRNEYKMLVRKPEGKKKKLEELGTDRKTILNNRRVLIHLADGRNQWRAFVQTVMILRVT